MRIRTAALTALTLLVAAGGVADAAPRAKAKPKPKPKPPICNLITDPKGDTPFVFQPSPGFPGVPVGAGPAYDPNLDILSADVANDAHFVTGVIRVARLDKEGQDNMTPSRYYKLSWGYASSAQGGYVSAQLTPTGVFYGPPGATGQVDTARNEIRISLPLDRVGTATSTFGKGEKLQGLIARTDWSAPTVPDNPATTTQVDSPLTNSDLGDYATTSKVYPASAPSCVKPGR